MKLIRLQHEGDRMRLIDMQEKEWQQHHAAEYVKWLRKLKKRKEEGKPPPEGCENAAEAAFSKCHAKHQQHRQWLEDMMAVQLRGRQEWCLKEWEKWQLKHGRMTAAEVCEYWVVREQRLKEQRQRQQQ
eukprot:10086-Heterococcus_DN1.PRE.1